MVVKTDGGNAARAACLDCSWATSDPDAETIARKHVVAYPAHAVLYFTTMTSLIHTPIPRGEAQ